MNKVSNSLNRRELKSFEGEFIYELLHSYELSPRLSEQILETAKQCLFNPSSLKPGQYLAVVANLESKSGNSLSNIAKCRVTLTLDNGNEDIQVLKEFGRRALRRIVIQRITEEAIEQGGILTQEDLSYFLKRSIRTIKRDICTIRESGVNVTTRGVFHNVGRGQTHKNQIIRFYLDGFTYSEIKRKTHHSTSAIKRYLENFSKILMSLHYGIKENKEISQVTGISEYLISQYRSILTDSKANPIMFQNLKIMLEQSQYRSGLKKTIEYDGFPVVVLEEK